MTDNDIAIADRIIAHLGGSDGLTALKASHIHTIPGGLALSVILKNPGSFHIYITEEKFGYVLEIDGTGVHYGPLRFEMIEGKDLLSVLEPIIWAAK